MYLLQLLIAQTLTKVSLHFLNGALAQVNVVV